MREVMTVEDWADIRDGVADHRSPDAGALFDRLHQELPSLALIDDPEVQHHAGGRGARDWTTFAGGRVPRDHVDQSRSLGDVLRRERRRNG
jgi:hypothetical protein